MLKRILIIIIVLNLGTACSRLSKKEEGELEKSRFYNSYSKWELDDLSDKLEEHKKVYGYTPEVIKFRFLLNERAEAKEKLEQLIKKVKKELVDNELTTLKKHMSKNLRNTATLDELTGIDFTRYRVFVSKTSFEDKVARNIVALNTGEETFYFNVEFKYENHVWEVVKFQERR
ncbi:hypothetical protein [uncultured Ilyobacter sp.]|jgi:hypothetical protein|uniref:hypothetical protein n=1 Tax=uncultured Ilyobacter sp. TaxID=544433 RepID=UPI0029BFB4C5|nr:hypothetical protein [uncultured Ilyobacter sp.]